METETISTRYRVRKQSSGRTSSVTYYVYDLQQKARVSVHASHSSRSAQYEADALNVQDMVRDYESDPRPYDLRHAEARATYERVTGRTL